MAKPLFQRKPHFRVPSAEGPFPFPSDSSKDLEKDEREAMETARHNHEAGSQGAGAFTSAGESAMFEAGWQAKRKQAEARLQQVEAELRGANKELNRLCKIVAEKDLIIKVSEEHTQYCEDKCAE